MIEKVVKEMVKKTIKETVKETNSKVLSNDIKDRMNSKFRNKHYDKMDGKGSETGKSELKEGLGSETKIENPVDSLREKANELREQFDKSKKEASKSGEFKDGNANVDKEVSGCPIDGHYGKWEGERGNSKWCPDKEVVPNKQGTNPENKTWEEISKENGIDGIDFKDGEPDFSEIAEVEAEIDDFSENRESNFKQADEALAEYRGVTPKEIKDYRKENGYTWHECSDCKTMQLVPSEVHGNVSHKGGISAIKSQN